MDPNYYLSPLAVALAIGLSSPAKAAEAVVLHKTSFLEIKKDFTLAVDSTKAATTFENGLQLVKQRIDKKGVKHVRMQQTYAGLPVFGGYAIMHSPYAANALVQTNSGVKMTGVLYKDLHTDLGKVPTSFKHNAQLVLKQFKEKFAGDNISEEHVTPMIYIDKQGHAHWAYKLSILLVKTDAIEQKPTAIIDAQTNKPLVQWDDIKTSTVQVQGKGYGGNTKTGFYQYGSDLPLLELTRDEESHMCFMETPLVKVVDMGHRYGGGRKPSMRFACEPVTDSDEPIYLTGYAGDGYDKENGAASPTNDALYSGYVINHLYQDWYDVPALTNRNGTAMQLVMRVHYGSGYENAYWDGKQMTFGDGEEMLYPLVSLGVAAHEISHGFTEQHSNLEYFGQSGGMNESFSDMASQAAEYYSVGHNSWQIGPEILKESSGIDALRYMDMPSKDGWSIDTAEEYAEGIDVHYSSGVYNHLFYLLANQPGWDLRKAFNVMVKANMDYWTPYSSFDEGACGMLLAAQDLEYSMDDVKKALDGVVIDYSLCDVQ